jgi:hypothetical protein
VASAEKDEQIFKEKNKKKQKSRRSRELKYGIRFTNRQTTAPLCCVQVSLHLACGKCPV